MSLCHVCTFIRVFRYWIDAFHIGITNLLNWRWILSITSLKNFSFVYVFFFFLVCQMNYVNQTWTITTMEKKMWISKTAVKLRTLQHSAFFDLHEYFDLNRRIIKAAKLRLRNIIWISVQRDCMRMKFDWIELVTFFVVDFINCRLNRNGISRIIGKIDLHSRICLSQFPIWTTEMH